MFNINNSRFDGGVDSEHYAAPLLTPDHQPWGAQGSGVTHNLRCIPLPASHSISGPLSRVLLCPCHMFPKQRGREVSCPVCGGLTLHSRPGCIYATVSAGEWTLISEWRPSFSSQPIYYADCC